MLNLYKLSNALSSVKQKSFNLLILLLVLICSFQTANAYVWDGKFEGSYNACDGSFTLTTFLFQDCSGCADYINANFALQFKDNTGQWQKILIMRELQTLTRNFTGPKPLHQFTNQYRNQAGNLNWIYIDQYGCPSGWTSKSWSWSCFCYNYSSGTTYGCNRANPYSSATATYGNYTDFLNVLNENDSNAFAFAYSTNETVGFKGTNAAQNINFSNAWWSTTSQEEPIIELGKITVGLTTYVTIKWKNPPAYLRNQATAQFRMPFATTTDHNFNFKNDVTPFNTYQTPPSTITVQVDPLKTINGLTATKNENCNNVTLNWSAIQDYCPNAKYRITRDNSQIALPAVKTGTSTFPSTYTDNNPVKGVEHVYKIALRHNTAGGSPSTFLGPESTGATGKVKSAPEKPFGLSATDDKCNQTIELEWSVNQSVINATPHTAFRIERATNSSFTAGVTTFDNIDEAARSYVDNTVSLNVTYYYRIKAKNGCTNNSYDISLASNTAEGVAPGNPPKVPSITVDTLPFNLVRIQWTDPSPYEDNYIVTRSLLTGGGATDLATLNKNSVLFVDSLAQICVDYVYKIRSANVCNTNGISSDVSGQIRLDAKLGNTFHIPTNKVLNASKGYYPNRVELDWSNNNAGSITGWKIFRKNMTTGTGDSILIASPTSATGQYIDYTADANIFYKYTIIGTAACGTVTLLSNTSEDIGFRYPSGTISGNIEYEGGIAVKDVKVIAQTSTGSSGYALNFTGTGTSRARILNSSNLNSNSDYTIEFWMKPSTLITNATLIKKSDYAGNTHYAIEYNKTTNKIDFWYQSGGGTVQKVSSSFGLAVGQYVHVTAVKEGNKLKLYKNGSILDSFTTTAAQTSIPNSNIDIGANYTANINKYNGTMDELRIYKKSKTAEEIARDYNRYINPEDNDLVAYFSLDENITAFKAAYDLSKSNNAFNENILNFDVGVNFSAAIPNASQLNNIGYTDSNGFYVINACKYNSTGQNFTITPIFGTHDFSPNNKIEFIGEGSTIKTNVNFTDNSSFIFNGRVTYLNSTCPMEGAVVYIDDAPVVKAGVIKQSGADGKFDIRVPIGEHFISVKYPNHGFSVGRYPLTEGSLFNFQANVAGEYQFKDSTLRKIVGRVVGGQVEGDKALDLGRSKNNIGKARIIFETILGAGCKRDTVWTIDSSGEYASNLLPVKYKVADIVIPSNLGLNFANSEGIGKIIDLGLAYNIKSIKDTVYKLVDSSGVQVRQFLRVDSTSYNETYSYVHRNPSTILMKGKYETNPTTKDSLFIGEGTISMGTDIIPMTPFDPTDGSRLVKYPIFIYSNPYTAKFEITEDYKNYDLSATNPVVSKYPVSGILNITSTIGTESGSYNVDESGVFVWEFLGGVPNLTTNNLVPDYNYTSPLQVTFNSPGANQVEYLPFPKVGANGDKVYRAYVFGSRSLGTNFVTRDVDRVEFILRDPPGTNSFATWSKGSKKSRTNFSGFDGNVGGAVTTNLSSGVKTEVQSGGGFGAIILAKITDMQASTSVDLSASYNYQNVSNESFTTETENNVSISTSSASNEVGHMADVFIGEGKNTIFGGAVHLCLVDSNQCAISNYECEDINFGKYKLARYSAISVGKGVTQTRFHYTTREIENIVIPNLISLRNNLFISDSDTYKLIFKDKEDKVKYGSNNDDFNAWGTDTSSANAREDDLKDSIGKSYIFYSSKNFTPDSVKAIKKIITGTVLGIPIYGDSVYYIYTKSIDKVRQYNKQILQWKIEMAKNEREKYKALSPTGPVANVDNLSVGTATIQKSYTTSSSKQWSEEENHSLGGEIALNIQADFTLFGVQLASSNKISAKTNNTWKSGKSGSDNTSTTFNYILQDENQGDLLNLAVKNPEDGGGHIFKVLAGQTSCPYQDAEYLKWYNPNANDNGDNFKYLYPSSESGNSIEFSPRTVQIDVPRIIIAQPKKINIPSDEEAVFNMVLGNESEARLNRNYTLKVDLVSNPHGAIIKVDGLDPNRSFSVPYGVGINKVITVEKGPTKFNYDSILLILHTDCDIDNENIADSVYISAHFIPACNTANIQAPVDQWTANNITGDTLPIIINDYNYNFEGFTNIQFKYKKSNTSIWNTQEIFHKDTTGLNNPNAKLIPTNRTYIEYLWNHKDDADGPYDIKLDVRCDFPNFPNIIREIPIHTGIIDKLNPSPFGTPSPGDGILDPNDDISIQFNEPLDNGTLTYDNFDIRGVLNETPIRNATSLYFNGTNNYMEVPGNINLQQRDFSIETWVKKAENGRKQTIFSQGSDANQALEIGFDADNKIYYKISSGPSNEIIKSDNAITDLTDWHHFSLTYNHAMEEVQMYWDGVYINQTAINHMYTDNLSTGKMYIAKNLSGDNQEFKGNLNEIRVWNKHRTLAEIVSTMNKSVNRSNPGALFNWRLEEANGTEAKDHIRERNAIIHGATWMVDPSSSSIALNGTDQYIKVESGNYGISKEMDMTLEFWFNSSQTGAASLFSNGKGYQHTDSITAWNIEKDASGMIHIKNNNYDWVATDSNYFDGQWHHLALILNRKANTSLYIDGNQQKTISSQTFGEFGGGNVYLGALGYYDGALFKIENHLNGNIDEFRFWNMARLVEQIKRDKQNRLKGDELGLLSYVPFEEYLESNGVPSLIDTLNDIADTSHAVFSINGASHSAMTPVIKLPRAVQSIQFVYSLNNDKIILTPTTAAKFIENVTLDITVEGVKDKNGNYQQSPKTWIAYIDKNQVVWGNDAFSLNKNLNDPLTINTTIANKGGATKQYTIDNIPQWMTVTPSSGIIAPNSVLPVVIDLDENMAIGNYENDLQLLTDFGFAEKLNLQVKCRDRAPDWTVNPADFQYSMNIIGKLNINTVISSDIEDQIAVFVGEKCRGVAKIEYVPQYDDYYVFLDLYSNDSTGQENFHTQIWDASVGAILTEVIPKLEFESNSLKGTLSSPIIFMANNLFAQTIPIKRGWNWISLNVKSNESSQFDSLLKTLNSKIGDLIKNHTSHRLYKNSNTWEGSLESMVPDKAYMLKSHTDDTLVVQGILANPTTRLISLVTGWNWIGFNSIRNLPINQALGGLNPQNEDLIKGKDFFAIYDQNVGWIGSLAAMKPGEGYLYKSSMPNSFYYPIAGYYKSGIDNDQLKNTYYQVQSDQFQSNMNMIAMLNCDGLDKDSKQTLAAFDKNGICRGAIKLLYVKEIQAQLAFLSIAGEGSEELSFRIYDENTKKDYRLMETIDYVPNTLLGDIQSPHTLKLSEEDCSEIGNAKEVSSEDFFVNVFPNEIADRDIQIELGGEILGTIDFELLDIQGKSLTQFEKNSIEKFTLNSMYPGLNQLSSGIYLLKVEVNNQTKTFKLIK